MKKIVALFLTFILIFGCLSTSYANLINNLNNVNVNDRITYDSASTSETKLKNTEGEDNTTLGWIAEAIINAFSEITSFLLAPTNWIVSWIPSIEGCIWGEQDYFQLTFFNSNSGGIAGTFKSLIGSVYNGLRYLVAAIYIIILVYLGIRMLLSSIGKQKALYKNLLKYWLTGLLILFAFHWVMAFAIWASDIITSLFANLGTNMMAKTSNGLHFTTFFLQKILFPNISSIHPTILFLNSIMNLIASIVLIVFCVVISYTYLKRLFTIALLIIMFPLVPLSYVFDKIGDRKAQTLGIWLKEFTTNVFVQPIHAFLLTLIVYILSGINALSFNLFTIPIVGPIFLLLLLAIIPMGEKQIKQLFQINSSMGPGAGGIAGSAHSLAHLGQAARTLKSMRERMSTTEGKGLKKLAEGIKNKENRLTNDYKEKGLDAATARRRAIEDVAAFMNSDAYKKRIKAYTGHDTESEAQIARMIKGSVMAATATGGVGAALASSSTMAELATNLPGMALAGGALSGSIISSIEKRRKPIESSPELDAIADLLEKNGGDLSKLDGKEKAYIEKVLGVDKKLIDNDNKNKDFLKKRLEGRKTAHDFGVKYDDQFADAFDSDYNETQNLKFGSNPDGKGKANWGKYDKAVTKTATYLRDRQTGKVYQLSGMGNSKAGDKIVWETPDMAKDNHKGLTDKYQQEAVDFVEKLKIGGAFTRDDGSFNTDAYDKRLQNEKEKALEYAQAQIKTTDTLTSLQHTKLDVPVQEMYRNITPSINNIAGVHELDAQTLSQTNVRVNEVMDSLTFNPSDSASKAAVSKAIMSLGVNHNVEINRIFTAEGVSYSDFQNGVSIPDDKLQAIVNNIKTSMNDQIKIDAANDVIMAANSKVLVNDILNNGNISRESLNTIVQTTTGIDVSNMTKENISSYLQNLSVPEVNQIIDRYNIAQNAEYATNPNAATIINAVRNGSVNIPVSIPQNVQSTIASTFVSASGEPLPCEVLVTPDGMATVSALGDPSKTVSFQTDISNGGDITSVYAGLISNTNGNIELSRSEAEADYSFGYPSSSNTGFTTNELYGDYTLAELQSIANDSNAVNFTIVKNSDICAILDANGNVLAVRDGLTTTTEKPVQFSVTGNPNTGEVKITSNPFANIAALSRYKIKTFTGADASLINRLLGK